MIKNPLMPTKLDIRREMSDQRKGLSESARVQNSRLIAKRLEKLASYCKACSIERRASALLQEEGLVFTTQSGFKTAHPAVKIIREATATMAKYQLEFGLTPAARSRVQIVEPDETDADTAFIFGDS